MKLSVYNIEGKSAGREIELPASVFGLDVNDDKLKHVVYLAVKQYLANQRQGTHKSKQRNEIAGSTRKLHRQKGTGGSRKGSIKNPLYHGGGRIFGPQPRNYEQRLNKKVKALARKAVLSAKAQEGRIIVVEDFKFDAPKTKAYVNFINSLPAGDAKVANFKNLLVLNAPVAPAKPLAPRFPAKVRGSKKRAAYKSMVEEYIQDLTDYKAELAAYNTAKTEYDAQVAKEFNNIFLSASNVQKASVSRANMLNTYEVLNTQYLIVSESALNTITASLS